MILKNKNFLVRILVRKTTLLLQKNKNFAFASEAKAFIKILNYQNQKQKVF